MRAIFHLVVCPLNDLGLGDRLPVRAELGEEGEGVGAHQLPDKGKREHFVALFDVGACMRKMCTGRPTMTSVIIEHNLHQNMPIFCPKRFLSLNVCQACTQRVTSDADEFEVKFLAAFYGIVAVTQHLIIQDNDHQWNNQSSH